MLKHNFLNKCWPILLSTLTLFLQKRSSVLIRYNSFDSSLTLFNLFLSSLTFVSNYNPNCSFILSSWEVTFNLVNNCDTKLEFASICFDAILFACFNFSPCRSAAIVLSSASILLADDMDDFLRMMLSPYLYAKYLAPMIFFCSEMIGFFIQCINGIFQCWYLKFNIVDIITILFKLIL